VTNQELIDTLKKASESHEELAEFVVKIVEEVLLALSDLKGYSGVGNDGNPYCTASWNAALEAVDTLIKHRLRI
jgi:hypothetical protein